MEIDRSYRLGAIGGGVDRVAYRDAACARDAGSLAGAGAGQQGAEAFADRLAVGGGLDLAVEGPHPAAAGGGHRCDLSLGVGKAGPQVGGHLTAGDGALSPGRRQESDDGGESQGHQ